MFLSIYSFSIFYMECNKINYYTLYYLMYHCIDSNSVIWYIDFKISINIKYCPLAYSAYLK